MQAALNHPTDERDRSGARSRRDEARDGRDWASERVENALMREAHQRRRR